MVTVFNFLLFVGFYINLSDIPLKHRDLLRFTAIEASNNILMDANEQVMMKTYIYTQTYGGLLNKQFIVDGLEYIYEMYLYI